MPTYVYKFVKTGETIEVQQAFNDEPLTHAKHPETGRKMAVKKVFTPVGVTFRGDGFYKTDSRANGSRSKSSDGAASSTTDSSSGTSSSATWPGPARRSKPASDAAKKPSARQGAAGDAVRQPHAVRRARRSAAAMRIFEPQRASARSPPQFRQRRTTTFDPTDADDGGSPAANRRRSPPIPTTTPLWACSMTAPPAAWHQRCRAPLARRRHHDLADTDVQCHCRRWHWRTAQCGGTAGAVSDDGPPPATPTGTSPVAASPPPHARFDLGGVTAPSPTPRSRRSRRPPASTPSRHQPSAGERATRRRACADGMGPATPRCAPAQRWRR